MICAVYSFPKPESFYRSAADFILRAAEEEVRTKGVFTLALSGGDTPKPLFHRLSSEPWKTEMPWPSTHVFWGDERCVSPDRPESNYRTARELLLDHVPVPENHLHRIPAEQGGETAAAHYQRELEVFFLSSAGETDYFPVFDCMLLGMGRDGHIASLFPGTRSPGEEKRWVMSSTAPEGVTPRERVTLTLPVIERAKRLLILVSGAGKRDILHGALDSPRPELPVSMIRPRGECKVYYMDFTV
jgi:6-phosphogluconolactonase